MGCLRLSRPAAKKTTREAEGGGRGVRREERKRGEEDNEAFDENFLGSICGSRRE